MIFAWGKYIILANQSDMIDRLTRRTKWKLGKWQQNILLNKKISMFILLCVFIFCTQVTAQQKQQQQRRTAPSSDDLYILLDEISVFSCRGGKYFFFYFY